MFVPRDVAHGSDEDIQDRQNTAKRLVKLGELIAEETDRDKRAWLLKEDYFLRNEGRLIDWPAYKSHHMGIERETKAEYAKQEQARLAEEKRIAALEAEKEKELRRRFDEENDPYLKWKREQSERTF